MRKFSTYSWMLDAINGRDTSVGFTASECTKMAHDMNHRDSCGRPCQGICQAVQLLSLNPNVNVLKQQDTRYSVNYQYSRDKQVRLTPCSQQGCCAAQWPVTQPKPGIISISVSRIEGQQSSSILANHGELQSVYRCDAEQLQARST